MTDMGDTGSVHSRAEEFLQVFKKGAEFTQGLLKENERLRYRVLELEQQLRNVPQNKELQILKDRLKKTQDEKQEILDRIGSVEKNNLDFTNRYIEIEAENNLLANLYITTYQLHSTFDLGEILRIIEEILLNLIGVERFVLFLRNADGELFQAEATDSGDYRLINAINIDSRIMTTLSDGLRWVSGPQELMLDESNELQAVIPLVVNDEQIGALGIGRLLPQKKCFTNIDEELFSLLSSQASMAICTAILKQKMTERIDFKLGKLS